MPTWVEFVTVCSVECVKVCSVETVTVHVCLVEWVKVCSAVMVFVERGREQLLWQPVSAGTARGGLVCV